MTKKTSTHLYLNNLFPLLASKIIHDWSRPIFNKSSDYRDYAKEERRGRDRELVSKKRKIEEPEDQEEALRPGDPG